MLHRKYVPPQFSLKTLLWLMVVVAAKIALTGLPDDEKRRVQIWFDHLRNWGIDPEVQTNSTQPLPEEEPNLYVLRTTSDVHIFYTVGDDEITVVDVARKDALRTIKAGRTGRE